MATPMTYVEAPPRTARPNTSLQVLPVIDVSTSNHLSNIFIPDPCAFPSPLPQDCWVTMGPAAGTLKTFGDPGDAVIADNFGAYQGVECWLSGGLDTFSGVAERVLRAGEYRVVDGALAALLAAAATATTPGTGTSAAQAIGLLETVLAGQVPAQGYLLMSPLAATYAVAAGLLERDLDGSLHTYLGTPVVVLTAPTVGLTIYASGPITIWRGPIIASEAPEPELNTGRALAERLYSIALECGVWKVTFAPATAGTVTTPPTGTELALIIGTIPSSPVPHGEDVTVTVQANQLPPGEVYLHRRINGGSWSNTGEMTQINPLEYVANLDGTLLSSAGDVIELKAKTGSTSSPTITVNVT